MVNLFETTRSNKPLFLSIQWSNAILHVLIHNFISKQWTDFEKFYLNTRTGQKKQQLFFTEIL